MESVSVIIVSWNCKDKLLKCLASLDECAKALPIFICLVDNASTDGTETIVKNKYPDVLFVQSGSNIGFAKGNNIGLKLCETSYILFLNPDTIINSNAIVSLVNVMKSDSEIGMTGCRTVREDGTVNEIGLQWFPTPFTKLIECFLFSEFSLKRVPWLFPIHNPDKSGYVEFIPGCCMLMRKDDLGQIGSFDERFFMYGEDADLCKRVRDAGKKIYYDSTSTIVHLCGGSSRGAMKKEKLYMFYDSLYKLICKHQGKISGKFFCIVLLFGASYRWFLSIIASFGKTNTSSTIKYKHIISWIFNNRT